MTLKLIIESRNVIAREEEIESLESEIIEQVKHRTHGIIEPEAVRLEDSGRSLCIVLGEVEMSGLQFDSCVSICGEILSRLGAGYTGHRLIHVPNPRDNPTPRHEPPETNG